MGKVKFLLVIIGIFFLNITASADFHTNAPKSNGGGIWESATSWDGLSGPGCSIASNTAIYIDAGDSVYTICLLDISGTPTIVIDGILVIDGMFLTGNVNFDIRSGGKLIINGTLNFSGNSILDVTNNGSIIINGGVMSSGGSYDFKCNGWVEIHGFGCDKCTEGNPDVSDCVALKLPEVIKPIKIQTENYSIINDGFSLSFFGYKEMYIDLVVLDVTSKSLVKKSFIIPSDEFKINQEDLNLKFSPGIYIISTVINYKVETYKLIIL